MHAAPRLPELTVADLYQATSPEGQAVLVYFASDHCVPCKQLSPVMEQLHDEWQGRVRVAKFDVLAHPLAAMRCGVMSAPELILFKGGQPVVRVHGYQPKPKLVALFAAHMTAQP